MDERLCSDGGERPRTLEYPDLRARGIETIESLSSHVWTDYNVHDPGITILEHLCYALTDLSYRTTHALRDLLTGIDGEPLWSDTAMFTAARILPCRPVTARDFRKVLVDRRGVKNAWLAAANAPIPVFFDLDAGELTLDPSGKNVEPVKLRGLQRVLIEFEDETLYRADRAAELESELDGVRRYIHGFRNLCEDFVAVEAVPIEFVGVCAELELVPAADTEAVLARVLFELGRAISPWIRFHSLEDLEERGLSSEEIFNGPLLSSGFVDDDELDAADRRTEIHVSDLLQVIFDVEGVEAVRKLEASSFDASGAVLHEGAVWILPLDPDKAARFSPDHTRFTIYKRGVPFAPDPDTLKAELEELAVGERQRRLPEHRPDYPLRLGRHRRPKDYYSIQTEFPLNYGIGRDGLAPSESDARKAQALQLKGYLLLFEQYLADSLAQLSEFPRLLSLDDIQQTFWTQLPTDIPGLAALLGAEDPARGGCWKDPREDAERSRLAAWIHSLSEDDATFARRRNLFLDHLAARFGERLEDFAFVERTLYERHAEERIVRDKIRFIGRLPEISHDRPAGFDQLTPPGAEVVAETAGTPGGARALGNVSGLEKRINALLGIPPADRDARTIRERIDFVEEAGVGRRFRLLSPDGVPLLVSVETYSEPADAETDIAQVLFLGRFRSNYVPFVGVGGTLLFRLEDDDGRPLARAAAALESDEARRAAIAAVVELYRSERPEERLYVVEHILLRPRRSVAGSTAELLPPCVEKDSICPGRDPYSFRVSVVLPYWPWRFRNMYFRRFLERAIREHAPSHVALRICWISEEDMRSFEDTYWPWRQALADDAPELPERQDRFVEVWSRLRSVFPHATLHDCVEGEDENPVVLDNTTLGTFQEGEDDED